MDASQLGQIHNFVAQQRVMAAQMLAQYGQRERDRDRDRRRDRRDRRDDDRDERERSNGDGDNSGSENYGSEHERERSRDRSERRDYGDVDERHSRRSHDGYSRIDYNHGRSRDDRNSDSYDNNSQGSFSDRHESRDRDEHASDKWMTDTPTNTILLRGLPPNVEEQDIKAELMMFGAPVKDVRLMKRKDTGASRGFAFVEFQNVGDSQRWMEQNQGQVTILNQYNISMFYSTPKTGAQENRPPGDWTCSKCGVHNFKRRDHCFKCSISKEESDRSKEGDGYDQVGHNLCNTLIFRGLDALTTEENIVAAVAKVVPVVCKNIRVIRDELTQLSKGYAFAEMASISDSSKFMDGIAKLHGPFEVDGKAIIVNYAKNNFTTVMATMNQQYGSYDYSQYIHYDANGQPTGYYDASGNFHYYDYSQYYQGQDYGDGNTQSDTTNAAAAVAQAAIQQAQAAKAVQKKQEEMQKNLIAQMQQQQQLALMSPEERMKHQAAAWAQQGSEPSKPANRKAKRAAMAAAAASMAAANTTATVASVSSSGEYQYPIPDVSTYQYDESSGYYYDPATGLYYDANTQYYYNSQTSQFLYWDGEKRTYLPAPSDEQSTTQTQAEESGTNGQEDKEERKEGKDKDKKEKVKVAKKIAKDMEKWAKALNSQKEAMREGFKKSFHPLQQNEQKKEAAAADAGFAILEKSKTERVFESNLMPPPPADSFQPKPAAAAAVPGLVAEYGEDSEEEPEADPESDADPEKQFSDWSKMACLLCKRQFPNKEGLQRHNQLSDLHKSNLEDYLKTKAPSMNSQGTLTAAGQLQYRDRAKERRQKYGAPAPPEPKRSKAKAPVVYEQPTQQGIGSDNIGNKLMQKMGWNAGEGLGRGKHGIRDPVQASRRTMGAGLGASGSTVQLDPNDTYKDAVKKTMFARFHEMD